MSISEYTLDKEFDILATWFRVGEIYDNGVKGKLHYSNASIILDLYDSFPDLSMEASKKINHLYGFSTKGEFLILNYCMHINEETTFPGFAVESYSVDTFYIIDSKSKVLIEDTLSQVESIQFSLNHLHHWINAGLTDCSVDIERSETQCFPVKSQSIVVSTGVIQRRIKEKRTIVFEENHFIEIVGEDRKKRSFDSFLKDASLVKKLIEFLNSSPLEFDYIEFIFSQGKGRYFFKQIERKLTHLPQNTLILNQIKNEFTCMLDHWFLKESQLDLIIDNYLNDLYLDYYVETKLVNSIRNLEVYYRNFVRTPNYIEERREALKADQQLLLEFVEHAVSEKHKQHFTRNILYIGEESLRVKLNDLIRYLPEPLFTACIKQEDKSPSKSRSSFINKLMETRNFYTHGDEAEKYPDRVTDAKDLLLINEKLKIIQRYYIYKELGLTEKLILSILLPKAFNLENE